MKPEPLTDDEVGDLLANFERSAFRLETRRSYAIGEERADFELFLAGSPRPPSELDWWRLYLDRVAAQTRQGKTIMRVRVIDRPPTGYQRWLLWAAPWYAAAGEDIRYLARRKAHEIGLPDADWWLLDDTRLITYEFTGAGEVAEQALITDPDTVARYRTCRDLAISHATPAGQIAAA